MIISSLIAMSCLTTNTACMKNGQHEQAFHHFKKHPLPKTDLTPKSLCLITLRHISVNAKVQSYFKSRHCLVSSLQKIILRKTVQNNTGKPPLTLLIDVICPSFIYTKPLIDGGPMPTENQLRSALSKDISAPVNTTVTVALGKKQ